MKTTDLPLRPEMARARAEGRMTMMRMLVKPQPSASFLPTVGRYSPTKVDRRTGEAFPGAEVFGASDENEGYPCPYGQPGDRIRWLTTWAVADDFDDVKPSGLKPFVGFERWIGVWSYHDGFIMPECLGRLRPGRFLPLFLRDRMPVDEIVSIRCERVQDITEEDALKEGIRRVDRHGASLWDNGMSKLYTSSASHAFQLLWDSIHGPGAWERNDFVWRIEFRRIEA